MVVILVDTLRADRLGVYGNTHGLTPFVDGLAAHGCVFERAFAQSPWTNPSVASLFTSRFQSSHGVVTFASEVDPSAATLASALRDHGYATGGFLANGLLGGKGFDRGFEEYRALWLETPKPPARPQKRRAAVIDELALAWLDKLPRDTGRPVFLYLHYVEPHPPYSPPASVLKRFFDGRPSPDVDEISVKMTFAGYAPPDDAGRQDIELVYDAEVASLDESLKHLFAELEKRGFLDHAVVVFTADHGEAFADHDTYGHGGTLYNELIHVPLIVALPGQQKGRRIRDVVSLIDVAPTVLDLAGTFRPPDFQGRSLRPLLEADDGLLARLAFWRRRPPVPAFSELLLPVGQATGRLRPHESAIVLGWKKLIVGPKGENELYDLAGDPGERTQAAEMDVTSLRHQLVELVQHRDGAGPGQQPAQMDPETERRLRAFGYLN